MEKRKIPISIPVMGDEELEALKAPIQTGWLTSGPKVSEFEKEFSEIHNVKHAIAVTSATTALHLALVALNIGPEDEVIVPAFTWVSQQMSFYIKEQKWFLVTLILRHLILIQLN